MGTQQILMIILSVIVVGAAVAVGIQMFDTQSDNQIRNMLITDAMQHGVQAQAWYRTPKMMGGGGNKDALEAGDEERIARYIDINAIGNTLENEIGYFEILPTPTFDTGYDPAGSEGDIWIGIVGIARSSETIQCHFAINLTGDRRGGRESIVINTAGP
jgi:hypothetical protein